MRPRAAAILVLAACYALVSTEALFEIFALLAPAAVLEPGDAATASCCCADAGGCGDDCCCAPRGDAARPASVALCAGGCAPGRAPAASVPTSPVLGPHLVARAARALASPIVRRADHVPFVRPPAAFREPPEPVPLPASSRPA